MNRITLKLFVTFFLMQGFAACTQTDLAPGADGGNYAVLEWFAFMPDDNPGLSTSTNAVVCNDYYCITVPDGQDLTQIVPIIQCSSGAAVFIDGIPYTPGTAYDFSEGMHFLTVISEAEGRMAKYPLLVKKGDPYIDNQVYSFMNDFHVPGVSISIMKDSEVIYSSGYGFADEEARTLTTPDHLFRVSGISMQFCTLCIMVLKEQGRLELGQQVFGENGILKNVIKDVTPYHESITVRHLLSHSSGITKGLSDPAFNDSYRRYADTSVPVPTDTLIQRTLNARQEPYNDGTMIWSAGMGYDYSDVGFCILHRIVEVVSGKDYESFLKEDVMEPMGITDTHIGGYREERRSNECVYYSQDGFDGYVHPLRELAGAEGVITSTKQMMKLLSFIDRNDEVPDILSHETLDEMYSPYSYAGNGDYHGYGLGWKLNYLSLFNDAHYHGGNLPGTATLWVGCSQQKMSGAFLCNSRAYNSNSSGSMDDNMYILMNKFFRYFEK